MTTPDPGAAERPADPAFSLRRIAVAAFGPTLLFGIGEGAALPVIALTAREIGASVPMAAFAVTLIGLGSLFNNVPASLITMRFGERGAIVAAGLWSALGLATCAFAGSYFPFVIGCFMLGMSQAVYNLARQTYLTEIVPVSHRARALSTLGGVMRVGVFVGPVITAAAVHAFGLRAAYGVGVVAVLCAAMIGARIRDPVHAAAGATAGSPATTVTWRSTWTQFRPVYLTLGFAILLVSAVRASRQVVIPLWADHLLLSPAAASLIYGLAGGVEMLLFYPAGRLMDLKGRRWVALPSMLTMGAALLVLPFTTGFASLLVAAMAIGIGNGLGSGMVMTLGADHSPKLGRAYFLGIWRFMADCGASSGPALLSALAAATSLSAGIAVTGGLSLLAAALLARWVPRRA